MSSASPAMTKYLDIVNRYGDQKEYHPLLRQNFNTSELQEMFWASLNHEIQLISQHSQELEDHEINLTQKAFKSLHSQGKLVPTANVYVELILGIAPSTSSAVTNHVLAVNRSRKIREEEACQGMADLEVSGHSTKQAELLKSQLHIYQEAKEDFQNLPPKSVDATRTARFLRDTAENTITYIQSFEAQPGSAELQTLLVELRETLERTNKFVERRCGGKKRVWEQPSLQQDLNKHALSDLNINQKMESGKDDDACRFLRDNSDLTQSSRFGWGDPSKGPRPRQQQPLTLTASARRRRHRNRCAVVDHVQPDNSRQSNPVRSHQGKGKRFVLPDLYRPS